MKTNILLSSGKLVSASITQIGAKIAVVVECVELTDEEKVELDESLQALLRSAGAVPKLASLTEHDDAEGAQRAARQFFGGGRG